MSRHTIQPRQASYCDPNQLRHACTHMISNRQALDPPTHVSQGNRTTGNRGQPQTTSAEGQERPRSGVRPLYTGPVVKRPDRTPR
jgi:hypothetical protein